MAKFIVPSCWCVHDDDTHLELSIRSFAKAGPCVVFVSKVAWNGTPGAFERAVKTAEAAGAEVVIGEWPDETLHRRHALAEMKRRGYGIIFIPDGDEVIEERLLDGLVRLAQSQVASVIRVRMDTFWGSPHYVIRPREELAPIIMVDCRTSEQIHIREYSGARSLTLSPEYGVLLHLSYAGNDDRIRRKLSTWGHRSEVPESWYQNTWKAWRHNRLLRGLHPTHPQAYGWAERIDPPRILKGARDEMPLYGEPELPKRWPTVSVVIPLYGGGEQIRACLLGLLKFRDLIAEIIVVDDCSPDGAAEVAASFAGVTLILNEENVGFGASCNRGYEASTGEVVLFLNSDTVAPRAGFVRLIETLTSSGTVGAAGPFSNYSGYHQLIEPTFTSLDTLDLFAQDFAHRPEADFEVNMLVGFCLAVRTSVLEEVGAFDSETFGVGMFEDNDLCYRIARAGYKLKVSAKSFVFHEGSKSLCRRAEHPIKLIERNRPLYLSKWRMDLELGYAPHLSGMSAAPIVFNPDRHPDKVAEDIAALAARARISACLIVRNEQRCIRQCIESLKPYFFQIVVVDTGSTDCTMEIAREMGAEVYEFPWTDSFSEARNESLKYAKGDFVFWCDADDLLPAQCGEHLLHVAIHARPEIGGFVVPVRFLDDGGGSTQVDHVKLVRRLPGAGTAAGVHFEFRLHEQILESLRKTGGEIARCDAYVLHANQDNSPAGLVRKREMHKRLMLLDLAERGEHSFVLFNLGMEDHFNRLHEEAVQWLQRSIVAANGEGSQLRKTYSLLSGSLKELGRREEALQVAFAGLAAVGEDPELRFMIGVLMADAGRFEEAKAHYLAMNPDIGDHFSSVNTGIFGVLREHNLGVVCDGMGDYLGARGWWLKALEKPTLYMPSLDALWKCATDVNDFTTLRVVLDRVAALVGHGELWATLGCAHAQAVEGDGGPEGFLMRAVRAEPQASQVRTVLVRRLLAQGREQDAFPHLLTLVENGVAEGAYCLGVLHMRYGRYDLALSYMEQAHGLDPDHEQTQEQIANLRRLLLAEPA